MSLSSVLPKPKAAALSSRWDDDSDDDDSHDKAQVGHLSTERQGPPPYGSRIGFVPKTLQDFGDGGAFPEIHMVQFPLDMGNNRKGAAGGSGGGGGGHAPTLSLETDESGKIRYDLVLHQGQKKNDKKVIHSGLAAMKGQDIIDGDESLLRPDAENVKEVADRTRAALDKLVGVHTAAAKSGQIAKSNKASTFVRYTPADQASSEAISGAKTRIIKLVEAPVDPMEPPRYKHKKVPRGPPSPPPPVMHSPPRKVTVEEQKNWVIPPCISNWKNAKGYTIPLDKRLANDGRGLQEVTINDNFAKLSEALFIADRHARDEVRLRAEMQSKVAAKEKREKEDMLRMLAQKAREERAGLVSGSGEAPSADNFISSALASSIPARVPHDQDEADNMSEGEEELSEEQSRMMKERDNLRRDKAHQRERELRMTHMGTDTKARVLAQGSDRDISEKIALGLAKPSLSKDTMFDQRLFNQSAGISSGFGAEDSYNTYDKPLFQGSSANAIYRPKRQETETVAGVHTEKIERLLGDNAPHRGFQGADAERGAAAAVRDGPVAFEKEGDIFGFQDFMSTAKRGRGGKDQADDNAGRNDRGEPKRPRQ
ncbi:hypothetical protein BASA50_010383 [Batrachochytrium salamandrivorans]|uniref:Pre-mRNA-processing protein 45 n=1 Tax=Batrachochytrium salamandrivorans TaxID=1357716 RepID=A0ABQ8F1M8_9FUNG|nr:hypothetical protein BASA50_010383 [Batrachochytrium salamandrivorans]KAH6600322.1 hypothetical protein BASA61_002325 [Batrachochytrium salamandrivorans]